MRTFLIITFSLLFQLLSSCQAQTYINPKGFTIAERFSLPQGYKRVKCAEGTFGAYVRQLKLKPNGTLVHYYNGSIKNNKNIYVAVVDMNIGNKDLQQCADVIMHTWAEYLYYGHQEDKIKFTFTNGFKADYKTWKTGQRIAVKGNKVQWVKTAKADNSYASFCKYMDMVYNYCGTLSFSKELQSINYRDIRPGDILIKGGSPGHAELVLDVAENSQGKKIYLLSQGYMPAQEMQVLANPTNTSLSPWYEADDSKKDIVTPEWSFTTAQLMRLPSFN